MSDIDRKAARGAATEPGGEGVNGANGMSDLDRKAAREAVRKQDAGASIENYGTSDARHRPSSLILSLVVSLPPCQ